MVVHAYNPSIGEVEAGESRVHCHPRLQSKLKVQPRLPVSEGIGKERKGCSNTVKAQAEQSVCFLLFPPEAAESLSKLGLPVPLQKARQSLELTSEVEAGGLLASSLAPGSASGE